MNKPITGWQMVVLIVGALGILPNLGCSKSAPATATDSKYVLNQEPAGATDVLKIKSDANDQEDVVVVGRVGGSENPWTDGVAAFSIVDTSLKPCSEMEGDTCQTPWDYCCEADLPKATVLVKFVDESGKIVKEDARGLLNLKELQTVVVNGKAVRDDAGNVSIAATGVHVRDK
jgi:hypothetical protein